MTVSDCNNIVMFNVNVTILIVMKYVKLRGDGVHAVDEIVLQVGERERKELNGR